MNVVCLSGQNIDIEPLAFIGFIENLILNIYIMSITVKSFDESELKAEMKKAVPIIREYIDALKRSLDQQKQVTNEAIKKIRELSVKLNVDKSRSDSEGK